MYDPPASVWPGQRKEPEWIPGVPTQTPRSGRFPRPGSSLTDPMSEVQRSRDGSRRPRQRQAADGPAPPRAPLPPMGPAAPAAVTPLLGPADRGTMASLMGSADPGTATPLMLASR